MNDVGFFDILIKLYPTGKMSTHLAKMKIGDKIKFKGPKGKLEYLGNGEFKIRRKGQNVVESYNHIAMIAGGSGITPMFQILQAIANNPTDELKVTLIFANKSQEDIILKSVLDGLARKKKQGQITIHYVLDKHPKEAKWQPSATGFISVDMLRKLLPNGKKETPLVCLCGPPPMIKNACLPHLKTLGWNNESIFKF